MKREVPKACRKDLLLFPLLFRRWPIALIDANEFYTPMLTQPIKRQEEALSQMRNTRNTWMWGKYRSASNSDKEHLRHVASSSSNVSWRKP